METPENKDPPKARDDDATLLAFDRNSLPAPVDLRDFTRRAGEIIARAAGRRAR
jgi:hypothetical protein